MGYKEADTVIRLIDQYLEELEGKEIHDIAIELGCNEAEAEEAGPEKAEEAAAEEAAPEQTAEAASEESAAASR